MQQAQQARQAAFRAVIGRSRRAWGPLALVWTALIACASPAAAAKASLGDKQLAFPSVGALYALDDGGWLSLRCSGTLVAPDVVLTAAHCLLVGSHNDATYEPTRLVFVPAGQSWPPNAERQHWGRAASIHPGFAQGRLERDPLYLRRPINRQERDSLERLEEECGERDTTSQADWLRCLTDQAPELQAAVGVRDRKSGDHDLALLYVEPGQLGGAPLTPAYLPSEQTEATLWQAPSARGATPLRADDRLRLVAYGFRERMQLAQPWQILFRPASRQLTEVQAGPVGEYEFTLQAGVSTCEEDSGGGLFRRRRSGAHQLMAMLSRRTGTWQDEGCGEHATAIVLTPYLPWLAATAQAACLSGQRSEQGCRAAAAGFSAPAKTGE